MKNKLLKLLTIIMILCFSLGTLFACSNGESGETPPTNPPEHVCEYGEWTSNGDSTHTRVCKTNIEHKQTENCSGGTATETKKPVCKDCNAEYGATLNHTHVYDKQITTEKFFISAATCTQKAKYYYSCECGEKDTEFFEIGETLDHNFVKKVISEEFLASVKTCEYTDKYYYSCVCGKKSEETFDEGNYLDHSYQNGKCTGCGASEGVEYEEIGNRYVVVSTSACVDKNIVIPAIYNNKPVTEMYYGAIENTSITSLTLGRNITEIRDTLWNCRFIKFIEVANDNVTFKSIDGNLYSKDGKRLIQYAVGKTESSFSIPSGVESIEHGAFAQATSLSSIQIPNSVSSIGTDAFYGCSNLTDVEIPNSVKSIENSAFSSCTKLESIEIPNSVTSIGYYAFGGCDSLTSITIDENNQNYKSIDGNLYSKDGKTIIQYAIGKTQTSFTIPDGVETIGARAFELCNLTTVQIPEGVKEISFWAFSHCVKLTSIQIPSSTTLIGDEAIRGCHLLSEISVSENNSDYKSVDGNLYSKDGKRLIQYAIGKTETYFEVPVGVETIESAAFEYSKLESVSMSTVIYIKSRAFGFSYSLINVYLGQAVEEIENQVFFYCTSLGGIMIPRSVKEIGPEAFYNCEEDFALDIEKNCNFVGNSIVNCRSLFVHYMGSKEEFLQSATGNTIMQLGVSGEVVCDDGTIQLG